MDFINALRPFWVSFLVLDGYFGQNTALQMPKQCGLFLISKLRRNAALYFAPEKLLTPKRGRPAIYGKRFNPNKIAVKYRICIETLGNITTEIYQMPLRSKAFADVLNGVCIQKTNLITKQTSYVLLFSNDLALEAEKMIDYYVRSGLFARTLFPNSVQLPGCEAVLGISRFYEYRTDPSLECTQPFII